MPYSVLPEDFAGRAKLLKLIGDVVQGHPSWFAAMERGENLARPILPTRPQGFGPTDPVGVPPPAIPIGPRIAGRAITGAQAALTPQQKYEVAVKTQQLQRGLEQAKRTPHPMDQTRDEISRLLGHERPDSLSPFMKPGMPGYNPRTDRPQITAQELAQIGPTVGLSPERMKQVYDVAAGQGPVTKDSLLFALAKLRQGNPALFMPEGGE